MPAPPLILVEGVSDEVALRTIARRLDRDLEAEGVEIVVLGGATNVRRVLRERLASRTGFGIAGLYDVAEEGYVVRALRDVGLGAVEDRARLEQLGFFACERDLEDELLRAVGERTMLRIIEAQGESASFRRLQHQPVQRSWSQYDQLRRFLTARSGNKARYAALMADAVALDAVPRPISQVLRRV